MAAVSHTLDFLIVGAGISGIGAACHIERELPGKRYAILEQRETLGGTWDVFRYPGIRCDSDMYSLGYEFRPWPTNDLITDGQSILDYLEDTVEEYGVDRHIRYRHRVVRASWSSDEAKWTVTTIAETADGDEEERVYHCSFLILCPGYFRYDQGYTPDIPGLEDFAGDVIHPQFWPDDYDHQGKRVVVIGSGATAVTLVPSLAETGASVTMLQRSPTYYLTVPREDPTVRFARKFLPDDMVARATLVRNTLIQFGIFKLCRRYPDLARKILLAGVRAQVGDDVDMRHFTPDYDPWDERLCAVPNGDLFEALRGENAEIVTDHIDRIVADGIRTESGRMLPADVIVTATGFDVRLFGGMDVQVDGERIDPSSRVLYNAAMVDGVPNLAMIFGYSNVSWTRKVDGVGKYVCRLYKHMDRVGKDIAIPRGGEDHISDDPFFDMRSGYAERARDAFPEQGTKAPWRTRNNVILDSLRFRFGPLEDGHLEFLSSDDESKSSEQRRRRKATG